MTDQDKGSAPEIHEHVYGAACGRVDKHGAHAYMGTLAGPRRRRALKLCVGNIGPMITERRV